MYPESLTDLIGLVDATRDKRLAEKIGMLSDKKKIELLQRCHPDYKDSAFRNLRVGVNKEDRVTHEFADLLESYSDLDYSKIDLQPEHTTDVLVLGGGGAGVTAALFAESMGAKVLLATKLRLGNSNTIMALGGMQSSVAEDDSQSDISRIP